MKEWYKSSTKVALQVPSAIEFHALIAQLVEHKIRYYVVTDEGRTCVEPSTRTCFAIEPLARRDAAQFVSSLKLLR